VFVVDNTTGYHLDVAVTAATTLSPIHPYQALACTAPAISTRAISASPAARPTTAGACVIAACLYEI